MVVHMNFTGPPWLQAPTHHRCTLQAFPFAEAVWKETLRLHPPGAFTAREMQHDLTLGGYMLPKGTTIHVRWLST